MKTQQRGGTVLGIILGIIVGLGAALGVAVYVSKVPVPFLSKGAKNADQDAAEARKNKDWDPNSPLYGKNPARITVPAAPDTAVGGAVTPAADGVAPAPADTQATSQPVAPVTAATTAKPDAKPDAKTPGKTASSDPLGDLVKAKSAEASAAESFNYFVQAGAFRSPSDAEAQRAKLAMLGWESRVSEREQNGRTVFRVRVGPFGKRDDAEQLKGKLEGAGVDSALVRVQR